MVDKTLPRQDKTSLLICRPGKINMQRHLRSCMNNFDPRALVFSLSQSNLAYIIQTATVQHKVKTFWQLSTQIPSAATTFPKLFLLPHFNKCNSNASHLPILFLCSYFATNSQFFFSRVASELPEHSDLFM